MTSNNSKIENLTPADLKKLKKHKKGIIKNLALAPFLLPLITGLLFLVPLKYLFLFKQSGSLNPDLSLIQHSGIPATLAILISLSLLTLILSWIYYKPLKLNQDIKEGKKVTLEVSITAMAKPSPLLDQIDVSFTPPYNEVNKIHFTEKRDLSAFDVGQQVQIIASKNALYPFEIIKK